MIRRAVALVALLASFAIGIGALLGLAPDTTSFAPIVLAGSIAFAGATWAVAMRIGSQKRLDVPNPDERTPVPVPGAALHESLEPFRERSIGYADANDRIVEGLYGAAIAVLTRFRGHSQAAAASALERGEWTDDPYAKALLSPSIAVPQRQSAWWDRIRRLITRVPSVRFQQWYDLRIKPRSDFEIAVDRTAAAIATIGYEGPVPVRDTASRFRTDVDDEAAHPPRDPSLGDRFHTGYWRGIGVVALLTATVGLFAEAPGVLLAGVVGVAFAGAAAMFDAPAPSLTVERSLSDPAPNPGDPVTVTVTITNDGDRLLPDVRFLDGVPGELAVTDGSARHGTTLRSNETLTISYSVVARSGSHRFGPAHVITRDPLQSVERAFEVSAETSTVIECTPPTTALSRPTPLRSTASAFGSTIQTQEGGQGTAFHSVREYRRGDPLNRVDWNRHARSGELATLEFHEERATRVVLLVDARRPVYTAADAAGPHAVERSVEAAGRIASDLLAAGNLVGVAAIGPLLREDSPGDALEDCWLEPGSGHAHRRRLQDLLVSHPQLSTTMPSTGVQWMAQLRSHRKRLSSDAQVILFTPLTDDVGVEMARRLEAYGHAVTVVSPDPTTDATTSQQLARIVRRIRRFDLQRAGIPVIDWEDGASIDGTLSRAAGGGVTG